MVSLISVGQFPRIERNRFNDTIKFTGFKYCTVCLFVCFRCIYIYIQKHYKKEMMYPAFSDDTGVPSSCFSWCVSCSVWWLIPINPVDLLIYTSVLPPVCDILGNLAQEILCKHWSVSSVYFKTPTTLLLGRPYWWSLKWSSVMSGSL